jgi:hypothetical protein
MNGAFGDDVMIVALRWLGTSVENSWSVASASKIESARLAGVSKQKCLKLPVDRRVSSFVETASKSLPRTELFQRFALQNAAILGSTT